MEENIQKTSLYFTFQLRGYSMHSTPSVSIYVFYFLFYLNDVSYSNDIFETTIFRRYFWYVMQALNSKVFFVLLNYVLGQNKTHKMNRKGNRTNMQNPQAQKQAKESPKQRHLLHLLKWYLCQHVLSPREVRHIIWDFRRVR